MMVYYIPITGSRLSNFGSTDMLRPGEGHQLPTFYFGWMSSAKYFVKDQQDCYFVKIISAGPR